MVMHLLSSTLKACTVAAVALPGLEWVTESVLDGFDIGDGAQAAIDIAKMPEGGGKAVASVVNGVRTINDEFAELAAKTGNLIKINELVGEKALNAADFTENFGIIPQVIQGVGNAVPDAVGTALSEQHRGALVTGVAAGGVAMAMMPSVGQEVHYTITTGAQQAMQMANKATASAREGLNAAGSFANRVTAERATAPVASARGA